MPNITYIPLHVHSDYSIMDGLESVGAIVKRGTYRTVTLCDGDTMEIVQFVGGG